MSENTRKSQLGVLILGMVGLLVAGWLNLRSQSAALEERIAKLEGDVKTLAPLVQVMGSVRPGTAVVNPYQATQATGEPDVPKTGMDVALAWCPATENDATLEWLELEYEAAVEVTAVRIHASYNPGAVSRILAAAADEGFREIWSGMAPVEPVQTVAMAQPMMVRRLRIEMDPSRAKGWNEIDAVALVDAAGVAHWAISAKASGCWNKETTE